MRNNSNAFRPTFSLDLSDSVASKATPTRHLDDLLQVLTRRAFLERLASEKLAADEGRQTFCLCLIDVDHLKNINDRHGQHAGDAVLIEIANRLRRLLALEPWNAHLHAIGRFEGDALMVFSQGCTLRQGSAAAEALRSQVGAGPLVGSIETTVSAGTAQYRIGEPLDETLARVERALHLAKQFGRDRVEAHPSPDFGHADIRPFKTTATRETIA